MHRSVARPRTPCPPHAPWFRSFFSACLFAGRERQARMETGLVDVAVLVALAPRLTFLSCVFAGGVHPPQDDNRARLQRHGEVKVHRQMHPELDEAAVDQAMRDLRCTVSGRPSGGARRWGGTRTPTYNKNVAAPATTVEVVDVLDERLEPPRHILLGSAGDSRGTGQHRHISARALAGCRTRQNERRTQKERGRPTRRPRTRHARCTTAGARRAPAPCAGRRSARRSGPRSRRTATRPRRRSW